MTTQQQQQQHSTPASTLDAMFDPETYLYAPGPAPPAPAHSIPRSANISAFIAGHWQAEPSEVKTVFELEELRTEKTRARARTNMADTWLEFEPDSADLALVQAPGPAYFLNEFNVPRGGLFLEAYAISSPSVDSNTPDAGAAGFAAPNAPPLVVLTIEDPSERAGLEHEATLAAEAREEKRRRKLGRKVRTLRRELKELEQRKANGTATTAVGTRTRVGEIIKNRRTRRLLKQIVPGRM